MLLPGYSSKACVPSRHSVCLVTSMAQLLIVGGREQHTTSSPMENGGRTVTTNAKQADLLICISGGGGWQQHLAGDVSRCRVYTAFLPEEPTIPDSSEELFLVCKHVSIIIMHLGHAGTSIPWISAGTDASYGLFPMLHYLTSDLHQNRLRPWMWSCA